MNDVSEKLKEVQNWCIVNKLTINLKKTNYMVIKGPRRSIAVEGVLTVSETVISKVHVASFVGIQIDESLLWKGPNSMY